MVDSELKKEIRTVSDDRVCSVCGRTILKGESLEEYVTTTNERREVCDLCRVRVEGSGWRRSAVVGDITLKQSDARRRGRSVFNWLRREDQSTRDRESLAASANLTEGASDVVAEEVTEAPQPEQPAPIPSPPKRKPDSKFDSKIHAIPSGVSGKVDAAIDIFNDSRQRRMVEGLTRSLGEPKISVTASTDSNRVDVVVAWELSWYHYGVELESKGLSEQGKGSEVEEIAPELQGWNARLVNGFIEREANG